MTNEERKVIELALEALETPWNAPYVDGCDLALGKRVKAITAIKEALAQPEQEPVGQLLEDAFGRGQIMWFNKPKDESMLYTTPPQRKPLTDEQILHFVDTHVGAPSMAYPLDNSDWMNFARAIEAAHGIKEKNNA